MYIYQKNLQKAVMENVQCRHLPLVGVSKRDKKAEKCKSRYLWLLSAWEHNATEFLFTFSSSIDYALNYVEFVPVQCQLVIEKIQVGSNWGGKRASDIFASNAVCSTSALERIRGSQINWKGLGSSWIEGCWGHIPDWERTPKSHLFWPHSARRLLLITLAARSN